MNGLAATPSPAEPDRFRAVSPEVLYSSRPVTAVSREDLETVRRLAAASPRRRARICAHPAPEDGLHEMLIVMAGDCYIRPHRHLTKSESFHVFEGRLTVVIFHDDGSIREVIPMGDYGSGLACYYRLSEPAFHTVLPEGEWVVFHETTNGPFGPGDTEFAPFAPTDSDVAEVQAYCRALRDRSAVA